MADGTRKFSPVRITASTEEAAVQQALDITGVSRDAVDVEVLAQDAKGVTVRVSPRSDTSPVDRSPADVPSAVDTAGDEESDAAPVQEDEEVADDLEPIEAPDADAMPTHAGSAEPAETPRQPTRVADPATQERVRALAQEFLDRMGMDAYVQVVEAPAWSLPSDSDRKDSNAPRMFLQIEGEDVGILIGKHGQTLQSFQYLLNLTLNNQTADADATAIEENAVHVVVDAGDYRARRATALERAAREAASRAKRDRRPVRMEPMPAHERRLIHLALRDESGITAASEGREPWRRVVVTPSDVRSVPGDISTGPGQRGRYGERGNERYGERGNDRYGNNRRGGGGSGQRGGRGGMR